MPNEKSITNSILRYLRGQADVFAWKEHGDGFSRAGLPDIIACVGGRFAAFEVKRDGGKLTALQAATLDKLSKAGAEAHKVTTVAEVATVVEKIRKEVHRDK